MYTWFKLHSGHLMPGLFLFIPVTLFRMHMNFLKNYCDLFLNIRTINEYLQSLSSGRCSIHHFTTIQILFSNLKQLPHDLEKHQYVPGHSKPYNITCASSVAFDHPVHLCSIIIVYTPCHSRFLSLFHQSLFIDFNCLQHISLANSFCVLRVSKCYTQYSLWSKYI